MFIKSFGKVIVFHYKKHYTKLKNNIHMLTLCYFMNMAYIYRLPLTTTPNVSSIAGIYRTGAQHFLRYLVCPQTKQNVENVEMSFV